MINLNKNKEFLKNNFIKFWQYLFFELIQLTPVKFKKKKRENILGILKFKFSFFFYDFFSIF